LYVETAVVAQRFLAELCQAYAEMARRLDALAILDCVEVREARRIGRWRPEWLLTDSPCPRPTAWKRQNPSRAGRVLLA